MYENNIESTKDSGSLTLSDGIIDRELWQKADRKLLFILKEYHRDQREYNGDHARALREWASLGNTGNPFFRNIFACSLAVHHPELPPPGDAYDLKQWEPARSAFMMSALINLKKVVGSSSSSESDIRNHAMSNRAQLRDQIREIQPNIVICGGTLRFVNNIIFDLTPLDISAGLWFDKDTGVFFIDAYHPAYRKAHDAFYDEHGFIQHAIEIIDSGIYKTNPSLKKNLHDVEDVRAFWFYNNQRYDYIMIENTLMENEQANTLRVTLRDLSKHENVEILFKQNMDQYQFRQDGLEYEYPLRRFDADDSFILYYEDKKIGETIYFHLR